MPITAPHPHSYARLYALKSQLDARGFTCLLEDATLLVLAPRADGPRLAAEAVCKPRQEDGGRLWYWTAWGTPLADAEDPIEAALELATILLPGRATTDV